MPDRVKEAVFSILGSHFGTPGVLAPLTVADVFAGGGSMGLEALSRGAARCCFFEQAVAAVRVLERNISLLGAEAQSSIDRGDAWNSPRLLTSQVEFDLIFVDPPYRDSANAADGGPLRNWLRGLGRSAKGGPVMVVHHQATVRYAALDREGYRCLATRTYGTNTIMVLER